MRRARTATGATCTSTATGRAAYAARWRYAGDFREGSRWCSATTGSHTHVDPCGSPVHRRWFLDLDVFHKGFARARDEAGWIARRPRGRPSTRGASRWSSRSTTARRACEDLGGRRVVIAPSGEVVQQVEQLPPSLGR